MQPKRQKPKVGQTLYSLSVGNAARRVVEKLTPVTVSSVERKFFTCKTHDYGLETKYHIDGWRQKTEYSADSKLYESEQEYLDEQEVAYLCKKIEMTFEYGRNGNNLPLDKLREINGIIDSSK